MKRQLRFLAEDIRHALMRRLHEAGLIIRERPTTGGPMRHSVYHASAASALPTINDRRRCRGGMCSMGREGW